MYESSENLLRRKDILGNIFDETLLEQKRTLVQAYVLKYVGVMNEFNKKQIECLLREFDRRYQKVHRKKERFLLKNANWLEDSIAFEIPPKGGRPLKQFDDSSDRSKRRKTEEIRRSCTSGKFDQTQSKHHLIVVLIHYL